MNGIIKQVLYKKYPGFFDNLIWGIEVGDGWYPLVDHLIEDILEVSPTTTASQIKEKYGTLRFYVNNEPDSVSELIRIAEQKSETICEVCGQKGENKASDTGWYRTRCKKHEGIII